MPGNRPNSRRPLAALVVVLLLLLIPAVSASDYTRSFEESRDNYGYAVVGCTGSQQTNYGVGSLYTAHIENMVGIKSVTCTFSTNTYTTGVPTSGEALAQPLTLKSGATVVATGTGGYNVNYNPDGTWKNTIYYVQIDDFAPGALTGAQALTITWNSTAGFPSVASRYVGLITASSSDYLTEGLYFTNVYGHLAPYADQTYIIAYNWQHTVDITDLSGSYQINIDKNGGGSYVTIYDPLANTIKYAESGATDVDFIAYLPEVNITIQSPTSATYLISFPEGSSSGSTATATIYVRSSATGAFVSNALVNATHLETGATQEQTLPSGSGTLSLIPSTGEVANYEINVTAPGYHDHILCLLVSGDMSIPVNLMPIGDELPENQTTLKFTIHQSTGGWLSGATVQLNDSRSGLTNAAGYCEFVVEKNSTISYSVKKSGFYPLSGSVVMGIYEQVILHSLIPTDVPLPDPTDPGETPGPTPTATPGSVTSHREAMRNTMEQQYGAMPTYVSFAFLLLFLAILKRGMR